MRLEVGGYHDRPDWPKMGPSLLIATCLIVAIRTAKWPARADSVLSNQDLNNEIDFAVSLADRVLSRLMTRCEVIFPQRKESWYQADAEDVREGLSCGSDESVAGHGSRSRPCGTPPGSRTANRSQLHAMNQRQNL